MMSNNFTIKGKADIVVSKDRTGNLTDAVAAAPENRKECYITYMKKGVYEEIVNVRKRKVNITILGDGRELTLLTSSLSGIKTFLMATLNTVLYISEPDITFLK
ncbi:putative pectinesterase 56 [Raphanus sativus]|nr:putative pectinesterase 56 [Raphanus sativus]